MSRLLVLAPEPIRVRMAGMGIRAAEIARHLALAGNSVTLLTPGPPEEAPDALRVPGVSVARLETTALGALAGRHDGAVVSGHAANALFRNAPPLPTLVDLYDPFLVENLAYAKRLGDGPFRGDHATLALQLLRGDRFLVSSPMQRAFYAGFLLELGRVNPRTWDDDPTLARLLPIVPFGVPAEPPRLRDPILRAVPGIGATDPILFFGGIYDWYDPAELLDALPAVLPSVPRLRVVFVASPNPETTPQAAYARTEARVRGDETLSAHVRFVPWFPYESRGTAYLEATAAVLTHRPGLETELSFRTRGLDFLWAGLPVVSHRGGAMSMVLERTGSGIVVDEGDRDALAASLVKVLTDGPLREALSARARIAAEAFRWDRVLAPVLDWASAPSTDSAREAGADAFAVLASLSAEGAGRAAPRVPRLPGLLRRLSGR